MALIRLEHDPNARSKAVATDAIAPATIVLALDALATALLPASKRARCDFCLRLAPHLRRCTACADAYYCTPHCQDRAWRAHHKKICKHWNRFLASPAYQRLQPHDRTNAALLSHLYASSHLLASDPTASQALADFASLLPGPDTDTPPVCPPTTDAHALSTLDRLYARFGNNNFAIHSHLASVAHGVFPLASRTFNHSCYPNAAARYVLSPPSPPRMEVVALTHIAAGDEVTLPYLDPALPLETRTQMLSITYGFTCSCVLCTLQRSFPHPVPQPPARPSPNLVDLDARLRAFARSSPSLVDHVPADLLPVYHESYLPALSEAFSEASHTNNASLALDTGKTLHAFYSLVYPPNYPQIGMHALEVAKSAWNGVVSAPPGDAVAPFLDDARKYLGIAREVLSVYGPEGDEGGPLDDIATLEQLLAADS